LGLLSNNSVDDQSNTELSHEHIFFEDEEGGDIGFFNDTNSPRPDEVSQLSKYKPSQDGGYDDAIMREAVKQVSPKDYKLCGVNQYNCQDWAQDVREKYFELESLNN
jgi:hypothetical protein